MSASQYETEKYQKMLNELARARLQNTWATQQALPAGSQARDSTMTTVDECLEKMGELSSEVRVAGIINGYGMLTRKAEELRLCAPTESR